MTDKGYKIDAIGINVDATRLGYLSQVEGSTGNGAVSVASKESLATALSVLGRSSEVAAAADDTINGGDGRDIIFGDVMNTDLLAGKIAGNVLPAGSGWAVFDALEGTIPSWVNNTPASVTDPAGDGPTWTRVDTLAYIRNNYAELAAESGRSGGNDVIRGGAGDDIIYGQEGNDTINYTVGDGRDVVDGGTGADTLVVNGSAADEHFFLETVSAYNTRIDLDYAGTASNVLVSNAGGQIMVEARNVESVTFNGGGGNDTLTVSGDFSGTQIQNNTIHFNGEGGTDTLDLSARLDTRRVVADGGNDTDTVKLGFSVHEITGIVSSGTTVSISHNGITDEFSNFENFWFEGEASAKSFTDVLAIDYTPPAAPIITSVVDDVPSGNANIANNGQTNDPTPTIKGTAESGSTVTIYDGGTAVGTVVATGGTWTFTPASLGDGSHVFTAKATDAAGNTSIVSAAYTVTIDTAAPSAPTISVSDDVSPVIGTVPNGGSTNDTKPTVTVNAESGSTVILYDNGVQVATGAATGGSFTFTPAVVLGNGTTHSYTATATDAAGNVSAASPAYSLTVDTTAPTVQSIQLSDTALKIGDTAVVTVVFSEAVKNLALGDFSAPNGVLTNLQTSDNKTWTMTFTPDSNITDASNAISVTNASYTDLAGNNGASGASGNYVIDTAAPSAPTISVSDDVSPVIGTVPNGGSTNDTKPTVTVNAESGSTVILYDNGVQVATGTATGGSFTFTPAVVLGNGTTHSYTATATDAAGNVSAASPAYSLTVDTTAPTVPSITSVTDNVGSITGALADGARSDDTQLVVRVSLSATGAVVGDTVQLYDNTTALGSGVVLTTTNINNGYVDVTTSTLTNGTSYNLRTGIIDAAGNASALSTSGARDVTIDTTAPTLTLTAIDTTGSTRSVLATFSEAIIGFTESDISIQGGGSVSTVVDNGNNTYTINIARQNNDDDIIVRIAGNSYTDLAGNYGSGKSVQDPIVLDLDNNGYSFGASVSFDINADGAKDQIAWNTSNDGILAYDVNGDGKIDSGNEIFTPYFNGGKFASGAAALASLDSNGDGILDADDAAFSKLLIWQDANGDGIGEAGELSHLSDHGISGFGTATTTPSVDSIDGQTIAGEGTVYYADGSTGNYVEVHLDAVLGASGSAASGTDGADTFVIDPSALVAGVDMAEILTGYSADEGDVVDLSQLLGSNVTTDNIGEFVRTVENGDGAADQLQVSTTGHANDFVTVAILDANAGVKILYNDDQHHTTQNTTV